MECAQVRCRNCKLWECFTFRWNTRILSFRAGTLVTPCVFFTGFHGILLWTKVSRTYKPDHWRGFVGFLGTTAGGGHASFDRQMLRKIVQISSGGGPSFPVEIRAAFHSFFAQGVSSAQISPAGGGRNLVTWNHGRGGGQVLWNGTGG